MNPNKFRIARKRVFLGYQEGIRGLISSAGVSASTGVGDAPEAEAGALSAVGLHMDAGDEHDWFLPLPMDLNWLHPIGIRVLYSTASATATDDREWILLYDVIAEDAAVALGTTALDTPIAAELDNGVANAWQFSPRGVINGQKFTRAQVEAGVLLALNLELDVDDASEELNMYGLVIDYVPKTYQGAPYHFNPQYDDHGIGS